MKFIIGVLVFFFVLAALLASGCQKKITKVATYDKPVTLAEGQMVIDLAQAEQPKQPEPITITVTVHFALDRADLSDDSRRIIGSIRGRITGIAGACCPLGSDEYNQALGLRRAQAVADFAGVRCPVESWGESRLLATDAGEYWKNRRAEITYIQE